MNRLQTIDDKIFQLKQLKQEMETRLARELYKKTEIIFGKDLSPSLVMIILDDVWKNATPAQKEVWRHRASTFSISKRAKLSPQNSATVDPIV